jgi:hypothetical protein
MKTFVFIATLALSACATSLREEPDPHSQFSEMGACQVLGVLFLSWWDN